MGKHFDNYFLQCQKLEFPSSQPSQEVGGLFAVALEQPPRRVVGPLALARQAQTWGKSRGGSDAPPPPWVHCRHACPTKANEGALRAAHLWARAESGKCWHLLCSCS